MNYVIGDIVVATRYCFRGIMLLIVVFFCVLFVQALTQHR